MPFTTEDVRREYDRLDALCGADTSGIELRVSKRASRRLGSCKYVGSRVECVTISDFVLAAPEDVFLDTIRHEYAHALVKLRFPRETHGHDAVWKAACREVGCPPKATTKPSETQTALREQKANYRVRCKGCGQETLYLRRGKAVELLERGLGRRLRCRRCGGNRFELEVL